MDCFPGAGRGIGGDKTFWVSIYIAAPVHGEHLVLCGIEPVLGGGKLEPQCQSARDHRVDAEWGQQAFDLHEVGRVYLLFREREGLQFGLGARVASDEEATSLIPKDRARDVLWVEHPSDLFGDIRWEFEFGHP